MDINPLLLKLYFVYITQNAGVNQLMKTLFEKGHKDLIVENTEYVKSIMTEEQLNYWGPWCKELLSEGTRNLFHVLESDYGVLGNTQKSVTHLEEYVPSTRTVLEVE